MAKKLILGSHKGKDVWLPLDFVTETTAILGRKGSGKSYAAMVFAEELLQKNQQVVTIDPLDAWWGLKSSANGREAGHQIVVFGGPHGDLPLRDDMGRRMAELIVYHDMSAILSVNRLSKSAQQRFFTDFALTLYEIKADDQYRQPMHLFIDEAHRFVPQQVFRGLEGMVGAANDLVLEGRTRGIGITVIGQRPAKINKDVLTQVGAMLVLQVTGKNDRKAIAEWVDEKGTEDRAEEFMASLPGLKKGNAWLWSPGELDIFTRLKVRQKHTFDSSATPKPGQKPRTPKKMAAIDLEELRSNLEEVIEEAHANDPAQLQARIHELEGYLQQAQAAQTTDEQVQARVTNAVQDAIRKAHKGFEEEWASRYDKLCGDLLLARKGLHTALDGAQNNFDRKAPDPEFEPVVESHQPVPPEPVRASIRPSTAGNGDGSLGKAHRKLLTVLAQMGKLVPQKRLGFLAGYTPGKGYFKNLLSEIRSAGWAEGSGQLAITSVGLTALGHYDPLPTGKALHEYWIGKVNGAEKEILRVLIDSHPREITRAELLERSNKKDAGYFKNCLSHLSGLGLLVRAGGGMFKAAPELFGG